jgi:polyhydroxybutyrate depolymerase
VLALVIGLLAPTTSQTVAVLGRERRYLLHTPRAADARPLPLVLALHGGSQTPEEMERMSGFDAIADRERFLLAYLEGVERSWNDGRGTTAAAQAQVDDVAFARAVVAAVAVHWPLDRRRIFATGASNGGLMTSRLGCEMADVLAGIGPVIGTIASALASSCRPAAPLSVVGIVGLADPLMPFEGGEEGGPRHLGRGGRVEGARAAQELWAQSMACSAAPSVMRLPRANDDGTSVERRVYSSCRAGSEVVWYEIAGGGHRWPGRRARPMLEPAVGALLGIASKNIDGSETIWRFFATHPGAK